MIIKLFAVLLFNTRGNIIEVRGQRTKTNCIEKNLRHLKSFFITSKYRFDVEYLKYSPTDSTSVEKESAL